MYHALRNIIHEKKEKVKRKKEEKRIQPFDSAQIPLVFPFPLWK